MTPYANAASGIPRECRAQPVDPVRQQPVVGAHRKHEVAAGPGDSGAEARGGTVPGRAGEQQGGDRGVVGEPAVGTVRGAAINHHELDPLRPIRDRRVERLDEVGQVAAEDDHRDRAGLAPGAGPPADHGLAGRRADRTGPSAPGPRRRPDRGGGVSPKRSRRGCPAARGRQPSPVSRGGPRGDRLGGIGKHRRRVAHRQPGADVLVGVATDRVEPVGRVEQLFGQSVELLGPADGEVAPRLERREMGGGLADDHRAAVDRLEHPHPFEVRRVALAVDVEQDLRTAQQRPLVLAGEKARARAPGWDGRCRRSPTRFEAGRGSAHTRPASARVAQWHSRGRRRRRLALRPGRTGPRRPSSRAAGDERRSRRDANSSTLAWLMSNIAPANGASRTLPSNHGLAGGSAQMKIIRPTRSRRRCRRRSGRRTRGAAAAPGRAPAGGVSRCRPTSSLRPRGARSSSRRIAASSEKNAFCRRARTNSIWGIGRGS